MKKNIIKLIASAAMLTSVSACSSSTAAATAAATTAPAESATSTTIEPIKLDLSKADGKLKEILDDGVLVIGTSPDFPPAEYIDANTNEVKGAEIQMAQYIADCLGVKLQIEQMDFNGVLTAVDTGKVDLGMSGFGYKKDRAESFEISYGYDSGEASCHTLLVPADKVNDYKTLEDFKGKKIAAQASSLQQMYVEDEIPDGENNLELVTTLDQAILDLAGNKVDAVALTCTLATNYAEQSNGQFAKSSVEFDLTPYKQYAGNIAVAKKGETSLIDAVNQVVTHVNDLGIYATWYQEAKKDAGIQ